ncbi:MAG: HEAT repeat domain-containing protein [Planctomycetota bacterium]|jgi:HEAT repeat protein
MSLRLLPTLLLTLLLGAPLAAQRGGLDLPPKPKPKPVEQETAEAQAEETPAEEEIRPEMWADPQNQAEQLFLRFELLQDDRALIRKRHLEELRSMGLGTRDTALKALGSPYAPSVMLAAEILEWVGEVGDAQTLVNAASSVNDVQAVGICLETALRLGSGRYPARAARGLDHPRNPVRGVFESRLNAHPNPEFIPSFLQFLEFGRDKDLRLRAARLLAGYSEDADARHGLRKALTGDSVEIAMVAVLALAGDGDAADLEYLKEQFLQATSSIEAAYLLYPILRFQDTTSTLLIAPTMQPGLRSMMEEEDPFISATAAAALAECVYRDSLEGEVGNLDQALPYALVRAVGGVVFFPQYARFAPLAESSLRRVTGEQFPDQAGSAWITWFDEHRANFTLVRGHIDVQPEDLPYLRVHWTMPGDLQFAMSGPAAAKDGDRLLGPKDQAALFAMLEDARLLDAGLSPGTLGLEDAPLALAVDIAVDQRRKRLVFRGTAGSPWVGKLADNLGTLYDQNSWQALAGADSDGRRFLADRLAEFDGGAMQGETRTAALLSLSAGRISTMEESVLRNWVSELEGLAGLSTHWTESLAKEFLLVLPRYTAEPEFATRLLALALTSPTQSLLYPTLDTLDPMQDPLRFDLLLETMLAFPVPDVASILADDRHGVRLAAVRALGKSGPAGITPLITALDDIHPLVVRQAIRGLGEIGDPSARGAVMPFASKGLTLELRRESFWAMGQMGNPAALETLHAACLETDPGIRVAAISAIATIPGPEATSLLGELFPAYAGGALETSYMTAVLQRGAGGARTLLRPHMLSPDTRLAERAALLDGQLGDPSAALSLMAMLAGDPRNPELLDALASTFGVDFRRTPDPAGTYGAWWADNRDGNPADWLRAGAGEGGFGLAPGFQDPTKVPAKDSVAVLLELLDRGPKHLRPLTCYFLYALTGVDAPVVLSRTPRHELQRRVQPWRDWLTD